MKAPVEVGKEYSVTVSDLSKRGEGVAKIQGFIIFVPGAKPSTEEVKIRIERVSARFASASLVGGSSAAADDSETSKKEGSSGDFDDDDHAPPENGSQDLVEAL